MLKKHIGEKELREILYSLLDYIHIIPIDIDVIKKGLKSKHKDFEDAIQINCAYLIEKIDCIVTRNIKDFRGSEIPVFNPDELIKKM
ncbi:MAG: PIN domain-containing protein [Bacteroidetes bacterium]|nr:PIN domain-containing protein [Bacteroidota bacterium]